MLTIAVACVLQAVVLAPLASSGQRVLVLDLTSTGVEPALAKNLSEVFAAAVRRNLTGVAVIGQDDIDRTLALEREKDLLGCADSVACLAEIGGALGADLLAVGSVGQVGGVFLLTLKLIRAKDASSLAHIAEQVERQEDLLEAARQWGAYLVDPSRSAPVGFAMIGGEGDVSIDGTSYGKAPLHKVPLAAGVHGVVWTSVGAPLKRESVVVEAYRTVQVVPARPPEPAAVTPGSVPLDARAGWYFAAEGGVYDVILGDDRLVYPRASVLDLEGGYTLKSGWAIGATLHRSFGGEGDSELSTLAGGLRVGPLSSGRVTLSPTLAVGVGQVRMVGPTLTTKDHIDVLPYAEAALALRLGAWRHLSFGLRASYSIAPPLDSSDPGDLGAHIAAAARLFVEAHDQSAHDGAFIDAPGYWWIGWGAAVLAIGAVNLFAGGDDSQEQEIRLGTVVVR